MGTVARYRVNDEEPPHGTPYRNKGRWRCTCADCMASYGRRRREQGAPATPAELRLYHCAHGIAQGTTHQRLAPWRLEEQPLDEGWFRRVISADSQTDWLVH